MKVCNNKDLYKTEFLFESDADKVLLIEASKPRKPKIYKYIIINTLLVSSLLIISFFILDEYKSNTLNDIKGAVPVIKNFTKVSETLNRYGTNKIYDNSDKYLIIVNKNNIVNQNIINNYKYVKVNDNLYKNIILEEETYKNYIKLKENLLKRNYYINITNGFNSLDDTYNIFKHYKSKNGLKYAIEHIPNGGESEHNTGLSFDFIISKNKYSKSTDYNSDEYLYLQNIAYLYGFIIRYPKDKETITGYNYKPNHLRYVGMKTAKYLRKNNLSLEEYYDN